MGGPDGPLRAVIIEKPLHGSELQHNYANWYLTFLISILVVASLHWLWWKRKIWHLRTIPTSNKNHFLMACVVIASVCKNKIADSSVVFFQLLCGLAKIHQHLKLGLFYMWIGFRPVVICFNADSFEAILKSSINLRKSFDYGFLSLWLKEGLVTSEGAKWKQRRKTITSAFHFRILEDFIPVFDDQSRIMINQLKKVNDLQCVDIVPYVTMCTLDIICETAMGIRIHAQEDHSSSYVKTMHRTCEAFVSRIMRPWLWPDCVYFATAEGKEFKRNAAKMDDFSRQVIRNRKKEIQAKKDAKDSNDANESKEKKKKAFLDLLLDLHMTGRENLNERDVQEEVDSFMFAGHDTTAVGISWVLYMLGLYPEVQRKVQEEVDALFGEDIERSVVEEDLKELKYLECVIKETQRVYPAAPYIGRQLLEDVHINGVTIPKGTTCMLMMYMLHRDEEFFPKAEVFDPDRFLPEVCIGRHPFAYCPFSAGPRSCIGQKFAILEEKTVIANFMRHFTVKSIDPRDKILLAAEMVLRSRHGIRLQITPRK